MSSNNNYGLGLKKASECEYYSPFGRRTTYLESKYHNTLADSTDTPQLGEARAALSWQRGRWGF